MSGLARLFEPGRIGPLELKNRIVMAPMGTGSADRRFITDRMVDYYAERAKGGVSLVTTEVVSVWPRAAPRDLSAIYSDEFIPGFRKLTAAVHEHGAKAAIQLGHLGIVASPRGFVATSREFDHPEESIDVVAPSALPYLLTGELPRELSTDEIEEIIEAFAQAGERALEAGFDAVEFHGAHGCLLSMFLSPFSNKRSDRYGGSPENRARFACEVLARTRSKVGPDSPLMMRINGEDGMEGGTGIAEAVEQAKLLTAAGAQAIHVSAGFHQLWPSTIPSYMLPPGLFVHLAEEVKRAVTVPVIAVGKLGDPLLAERVLEEGKADFVALGRALLADPEWAKKAEEGRLSEIRRCIYCNNCTEPAVRAGLKGRGRACTVNPGLLREREFTMERPPVPKKTIVVGGGLSGMEAARVLAERGHRVALYERSAALGGQWNIACQEPWKEEEYVGVTVDLIGALKRLEVPIVLNTPVTADLVREACPDVVVLATGAVPATLDVPGVDGATVFQCNDVIARKVELGENVVVVGGRYRGLEAACYLAEQSKRVSLVTRRAVGRGINHYNYLPLRERLIRYRVQCYPNSQVVEIRENGVTLVNPQELLFLRADSVVLAVGSTPENVLARELEGLVAELHCIGDCVEPRTALEAMNEGAEVARLI